MRKPYKPIVLFFCFILFASLLMSCNSRSGSVGRKDGCYAFDCVECHIPKYDDCLSEVIDVLKAEDCYLIFVISGRSEEHPEPRIAIYKTNLEGIITDVVELPNSEYNLMALRSAVIDNELAVVDYDGNVDLYNVSDMSFDCSIGQAEDIIEVADSSDGFLIFSNGTVTKYYDQGREPVTVTDARLSSLYGRHSYFTLEKDEYIIGYSDESLIYYRLDFDSRSLAECEDPYTLIENVDLVSGGYISNPEGVYRVNLTEHVLETIVKWDYVDIRPPSGYLSKESYYFLDTDSFAKVYDYMDGSNEVLLFSYNSSIDCSSKTEIVIGGFDIQRDISMQWAIYKYNTSQDQYRVICDDYTSKYNWDNGTTAEIVNAELIRYFEDGNAPDIFYGYYFDYDQLAETGTVINLHSYIDSDPEFIQGRYYFPTIDEGPVNYLYSGFISEGFCVNANLFPGTDNVSFDELEARSEETGIPATGREFSIDLLYSMVSSGIKGLLQNPDEDSFIPSDVLRRMVSFSVEYGINDQSEWRPAMYEDIDNEMYLMSQSYISDIRSFSYSRKDCESDLTYIGIPSFYGSVHVIKPIGEVAISATTAYSEQCWAFIKGLLDEEVQKIICVNSYIPVNENVLSSYVYYMVNPEALPEDERAFRSFLDTWVYEPIDEGTAELYMNAVYSMDTIYTIDWGVYNIINEELNSYYLQGRSVDEISESIQNRLELYVEENYTYHRPV